MASNNQRAPSAPLPSRWSNNESKKNSKEHQKLILDQVKEMFDSILEPDIILSVVQNCKWKLQPSIDALIMLSENAEVPSNQSIESSAEEICTSSSLSNIKLSKIENCDLRSSEESCEDIKQHKSNIDQDFSSVLKTGSKNSYLNFNEKELQRQQAEFRKFELLKKDITDKGFVASENENISKPASYYSEKKSKIPLEKIQQFGQNWSSNVKSDSNSKIYFCADVENSNAIHGAKKNKGTNNQFTDNLFGSKLQFSRDSPNKIGHKGTIPKSFKMQGNIDPAIISATPKNSSSSFDDFAQNFGESKAQKQQQVEQFDTNYDNEVKGKAGSSKSTKSNNHKTETESLCGLKVQYRLPGLEGSSDDDADVVIEEESEDYPTQIPSLMSINVCQFISNSAQSTLKNTQPEILTMNTPSPPRSPQRNTHDDKIRSINAAILDGHKVLIILRGLPGSGKTHLANSIVRATVGGDRNQFIFSSDDYFVMIGKGTYHYVRSKLTEAHSYNQKRSFNAMREGVSPVIIDNTNTKVWEMQPYAAVGVQNGYRVEVLEPNTPWSRNINELAKKNSHGVQKDSLRHMLERFDRNINGTKLIDQFSLRYSPGNLPPQFRCFPFFGVAEGEGEKNEKQKVNNPPAPSSGNKNRNRRKKKNASNLNPDNDPMNYLLSDSDRNMKHQENSPMSKNSEDTLDNIVSNALMAENDTLNKSLVDYCIETDSGDEVECDKVPDKVEDQDSDKSGFNLMREDSKMEKKNSYSSHSIGEEVKKEPIDPPSSVSPSPVKASPRNGHINQNLGAIGSERKGSVTNIDSENLEFERNTEKTEKSNVLSQCWDFTLLVNGTEIHSTFPQRTQKSNDELEKELKKDLEQDSESTSGVIITEITDDLDLDEFLGDKSPAEDPDAIINKIINKMDASEPEINSENKAEPEIEKEKLDGGGSSFGSIFNIIRKSFLGSNSEEEPSLSVNKSEESIMRFKYQTNDNSLSENDAFENEKSHREPSAEEIISEKENGEQDNNESAFVTIVGDNLSQKLIDIDLSSDKDKNFDNKDEKIKVSEPVTFDTIENTQDLEFIVQDNLSEKLSEEKKGDFESFDGTNDSRLTKRCVYSSVDCDDMLKKNPEEIIESEINEEDNSSIGNEEDSENLLLEVDKADSEKRGADPVYDILSEAVNRIISRQETQSLSQAEFKDCRKSISDEEESESSQTESSYLTSKSGIVNEGAKAEAFKFLGNEKEADLKKGEELLFEIEKQEEEILSGIKKNSELKIEDKIVSEENVALFSLNNYIENDSDSSIEQCCEDCDSDNCRIENFGEDLINDGEKVETEDEEREKEAQEIVDNLSQVTWKESPFPVPMESINFLLEKEKTENIEAVVERSDSSTNTSNYDFNVLYVGGTSEPEYKILPTKSRTINSNSVLSLSEKPPLKLMLDKSSMTSVVDILSGEESLEFRSEIETMKDLEELIEMFPNVPQEDIKEIYNNLCSCNFSWAVDMLLDGVPEDVTKYGKIEAPKIQLTDRKASGSDLGDLESQNSTPRREKGDKLKRQSSSAESNDSETKLQLNSSPKKKRDRHKVSEESLELKRQIEEKMIINEACYNPHILRVKRWKNGEPDIPVDSKDPKEFKDSIEENSEESIEDTNSPKSSESFDDFTEDDIDEEEVMELNLGEDFIKVLANEFGNSDFQFPGGLFPVIQIKKSMAQQLHALWIESMELQLNAQQEQLDMMIEKDAEYARRLEQEEVRSLSEPSIPNIPEIMDMEMALAIYRNDLKKQIELETPNDMASRLKRQMLHDMFTDHDPGTLDEILKAHNGNFKETVEVLEASTGKVVNRNDTLKKQQSLIDRAQRESIQSNEEERTSSSIVVVNPDLGQSSNSNYVSLTCDDALQEAKAARNEAQRQLLLRNENFNKAKEAIRKGNPEVAGYYSQIAKLHAKKREWANSTAASAFLAAQGYKMNTENTLDLHYLYVAEALQALEVFLDYQISKLNDGNKKSINLYIITGRGARSSQGLSRIKPAVSKKLASKNIRYVDENPGCLKVVLYKRNTAGG